MKLVRPTTVDDTVLTSSNILEDDHDEYNSGTTYAVGEYCIVTGTVHKIYESLQADNIDNYPPDNTAGDTPYWLDHGATNKWAMFDGVVGTQTEGTTTIEIGLSPGGINAIGLLDVEGVHTATVDVYSGASLIYSESKSLVLENRGDWYEFFHEEVVRSKAVAFTEIPSTSTFTVAVTLTGDTGDAVKCGLCLLGRWKSVGASQYGLNSGTEDFSVKTEDTWGNKTWDKRENSKTLSVDLGVKTERYSEIHNLLSDYTAIPVLWVGVENHGATIVYGPPVDFSLIFKGPKECRCALEIEGLI